MSEVWPVYSGHCMSGIDHLERLFRTEEGAGAYVGKRMAKLKSYEKALSYRFFVGRPMEVHG